MPSLTLNESRRRAELLSGTSYDLTLDLTDDGDTFRSTAAIHFAAGETSETFLVVKPKSLLSARLDGKALDVGRLTEGRLPLDVTAGEHELVVDAVMGYRTDGEGMHRAVDPADGRTYTYGMSFLDAAPYIFACFDQPDLKAPYAVEFVCPEDWAVVGNGRAERRAAPWAHGGRKKLRNFRKWCETL